MIRISKQVSITLTITVVFALIIAAVIPSEVYYEQRKNIPTDPVAVFEQLDAYSIDDHWCQSFGLDSLAFEKISKMNSDKLGMWQKESEAFREIKYSIDIDSEKYIEFGFLLEPNSEGTLIICYIHRTGLNFPIERWRSLIIPVVMRQDFQSALEKINFVLVE